MSRSLVWIFSGVLLAAGDTLVPQRLGAQALSGRVVDGATRRPLAGVAVVLLRGTADDTAASAVADAPGGTAGGPAPRRDTAALASAVTGPDGVFLLSAPAPGTYRARIGAAFVTPPITLASAESFEAREYQLAAPAVPASLAAAAGAAPAAAPSSPPACSKAAVQAAMADGASRTAPEDRATGVRALGAGPTLCEFQVEKRAATVPGTLRVRYPNELLNAANSPTRGRVVTQFVVDERGNADMTTFNVLEASDPAFVAPVWEAVSRARFSPAEIGRHHTVRQLVQLPFTFTLTTGARRGGP